MTVLQQKQLIAFLKTPTDKELFLICFAGRAVLAQDTKTAPVITAAFSDSIKNQILLIKHADFSITRLVYASTISANGKLLRPLIMKQFGGGSIEDNDFVVKLRLLLMAAPAWEPAFDKTKNKAITDSVFFEIKIENDTIVIEKRDKIPN